MHDICSTCLSKNRSLKSFDLLRKEINLEWLQVNFICPSSELCWECVQHLRHADRFRKRATDAQSALNAVRKLCSDQYYKQLTSLSTLSTVKLDEENCNITVHDDHYVKVEMREVTSNPLIVSFKTEDEYIGNDSLNYISFEGRSSPYDEKPLLHPTSSSLCSQDAPKEEKPESYEEEAFTNDKDSTGTPLMSLYPFGVSISDKNTDDPENKSVLKMQLRSKQNKSEVVTTSAKSTAQRSTNVLPKNDTAKSKQKRKHFHPEDNMAYTFITVSEDEMMRYREVARNEPSFKNNVFKCELCIKSFNSQTEFFAHVSRVHDKPCGPLLCEICSSRFSNKDIFHHHYVEHRKVYECLKCSCQHLNRDAMYGHLQEKHNIFLCQYCFAELRSDVDLTEHVVTTHMSRRLAVRGQSNAPSRSKGPVKCEQCGKTFSCNYKRRMHMKSHISIEKRLQECPHCHKRLVNLDCHIRTKHKRIKARAKLNHQNIESCASGETETVPLENYVLENEESYCDVCDTQFVCVGNYKTHLRTSRVHNPNLKFECKICLKQLANEYYLRQHVKVVHDQHRPFVCELCEFAAGTTTHLKRHIRLKHEADKHVQPKKRKNKICQYCGTGFSSSSMLKNHIVTHTGEKKYHCAHCPWKFATRGPFITHLRGKHPEVILKRKKRK